MSKDKIKHLNGTQYIEVESVRLDGVVYKRFIGADVMNPEVIFFESESGKFIEKDNEIYIRLREKYAPCKEFFHGRRIIDIPAFDKAKKLITSVILYGGIASAALLGGIDTAKADVASYYMDSKAVVQSEWQAELKVIPSLKGVKVLDIESGHEIIKDHEYAKTRTIINSGKNKGKTLSTMFCDEVDDVCYRENSDFFVNMAEKDLNNTFLERDIKTFSERAANDKVLSAIAKKHGIDNVAKWYMNKMKNVEKYTYDPDQNSNAYYDMDNMTICFSSFMAALSENTRAHEMSHGISHVRINANTERVGLRVSKEVEIGDEIRYDDRGRGINEGVTMLIAEKLSGEKAHEDIYKEPTKLARDLRGVYGEELLFESYLHDLNILANEMNKDHKDPTAFTKFVHGLDEFLRLDDKINDRNTNESEIEAIENLRNKTLSELQRTVLQSPKAKEIIAAKSGLSK